MRTKVLIAIGFLAIGCNHQKTFLVSVDDISSNEKHIILMHPTVNNIRTFEYLVNKNIFELPKDYRAIGVYHEKEAFDYSKTEKYIQEEGITNVTLIKISNDLSPENIFRKNDISDIFYKLFKNSNGAIFFGGPDIPPTCYKESNNLLTIITDPYRHYLELSFLFHLLGGLQDTLYTPILNERPDYPLLGICLGMQSINVATGGTMIQDIPTEIYNYKTLEEILGSNKNNQHRNYQTNFGVDNEVTPFSYHQIAIEKSSPLISLVSNDTIHPYVPSSHHQCIEKLGKNIKIGAWSMDGKIAESIYHSKYHNVLGVQFHPEMNDLYRPEDKIKNTPFKQAEQSYLDMYSGDKGENFQRALWKKFAEKFK